jgi:hypothetical protein
MLLRKLVPITLLGLIAPLCGAPPQTIAQAQSETSAVGGPTEPTLPPPRTVHRRITISPRPLLYRRCTDWYELQYRPSGTVLYPQMHCWWVRG